MRPIPVFHLDLQKGDCVRERMFVRQIKQKPLHLLCLITLAMCALAAPSTSSGAQLELSFGTSVRPILPGQPFNVYVSMSNLGGDQTAGFQAFLEFDTADMSFVGGTYMPVPFGLPIIAPITAVSGTIDLASGIDTFSSQPPTSADATLVHLQFIAVQQLCDPVISFRAHDPPTRLTDPVGQPVLPLTLVSLTESDCPADIEPPGGDGIVDVHDLFRLLSKFGEPPPSIADIAPNGCDGVVDVNDLFDLLAQWGDCP